MTRRSLFDDDDEPQPRPRRGNGPPGAHGFTSPPPAPPRPRDPESLEGLLEQMETILHIKTYQVGRGPWHARATGCSNFGTGMTIVEAMRDALIVKGTKG